MQGFSLTSRRSILIERTCPVLSARSSRSLRTIDLDHSSHEALILLLHDGELRDVRSLLDEIGVPVRERVGPLRGIINRLARTSSVPWAEVEGALSG